MTHFGFKMNTETEGRLSRGFGLQGVGGVQAIPSRYTERA